MIEEDLYRRVREDAEINERTASQHIRYILKQYLEKERGE